jgi:hypothetical protein
MGAWGHKSFENDTVMDWTYLFVEWVDSKYSKIPKANVEEFKNDSIKEFDRLYKLISNSEQV